MSESILAKKSKYTLPEFVRIQNPNFVAFLEAYFQWAQSSYSSKPLSNLQDINDVDESLGQFQQHFRNQFLTNFPQDLGRNSQGNTLSKQMVIKKIKDFYRSKGTKKSFQFFFRVLFDSDVQIYLPKEDILTASGGRYISQTSIRTTANLGSRIFDASGKRIQQFDRTNGQVNASAQVQRVIRYQAGPNSVTQLFLSNIAGQFTNDRSIKFNIGTNRFIQTNTYGVLSDYIVQSGGLGHSVGQRLGISGGSGVGAVAQVSRIGPAGDIREIRVVDFGVGYDSADSISLSLTQTPQQIQAATSASISVQVGGLCSYPGFYVKDNNTISGKSVFQDNRYYQNYSYVLRAQVAISKYRDLLKNILHPAGFGFYGTVSIKRTTRGQLNTSGSILTFQIPRIGNYAPYTLNQTDDLSVVYPQGYFSPFLGATLATPGDSRGDPYWVVFSHPNTRQIEGIPAGISFGAIKVGSFTRIAQAYTFAYPTAPSA